MPHTFALMKAGLFSQWQATILARETACLSLEDRRVIDYELCATGPGGEPAEAVSMGLRQLENAAKKLAITLDQESVVARAANAAKDRRVSLRPAPDTMTWLGALLPVKDGVAVFAALDQAAKAAAGCRRRTDPGSGHGRHPRRPDHRPRGSGGKPRIEVKIVMTADSLTSDADQPAMVEGYGPVPAAWAREALADAEVFVRRLFTDPAGRLVAMESRSRKAPDGLAEFIATRDGGICRTNGCDAPIRNIDHVERHADGGETSAENLQGLCERCNQAKEALGWQARPGPDGSIITITPTGHTYTSPPPDTWHNQTHHPVAGRVQAARRTPRSHPRGLSRYALRSMVGQPFPGATRREEDANAIPTRSARAPVAGCGGTGCSSAACCSRRERQRPFGSYAAGTAVLPSGSARSSAGACSSWSAHCCCPAGLGRGSCSRRSVVSRGCSRPCGR